MKSRLAVEPSTTLLLAMAMRLGASCTPTEGRSSEAGRSSVRSTVTTWSARGPRRCRGRQRDHESFFSLLQENVLNRQVWNTRDELRIAIVRWIERPYHRCRRQASLGRLTPVEYELIMAQPPLRRPNPNCP